MVDQGLVRPVQPMRRPGPMQVITRLPLPPTAEQEALMRVASQYARIWPGWDRFLIGWCAAFHGLIAFTLAFAPFEQIYNAGTAPVYEITNRYGWAALFAFAAATSALLLHRQPAWVQLLTWFTVLPLGGMWLIAFVLAVINGRGSAIGVVVWPFLYGPWIAAAIRVGLGKR